MPRTVSFAVLGLALAVGSGTATLLVADRAVGRLTDVRFAPLVGAPGTHTILARTEFRVPVRTNAAGFRGPELPASKPPGVFRIVALGDSFTWGYGVREQQAYPARLARLLNRRTGGAPRVEVVNLGVPGAGPFDYLYHLTRTGLALEPDLVLVGLFANDVNDVYQVRRFGARSPLFALDALGDGAGARSWWKRAIATATPNLYALASRAAGRLQAGPRTARAEAPAASRPVRASAPPQSLLGSLGERYGRRAGVLARYRALTAADRAALDRLLADEPLGEDMRPVVLLAALVDPDGERDSLLLRSPERRAAWRETARVLGQIATRARRAGARTVFAVLPASEQVDRTRWPFLRDAGFRLDPAMLAEEPLAEGVQAVAVRADATAVDLVRAFRRRRGAPLYFHADEHWNTRGHAFAATRLAAAILPEVR